MKNIKTFNNYINESVTFYVNDGQFDKIENILDLSHYLRHKVYNMIESEMNPFEINKFVDERALDLITPDGSDAFKASGIINFYTAGLNEKYIEKAISVIKKELDKLPNVKYNPNFKRERTNEVNPVIRIPILNISVNDDEIMPEVNLSNENFKKIMQNILGYTDIDYSGSISISELIIKLKHALNNLDKFQSSTTYNVMKNVNNPVGMYGPKELGQDYYKRIIENLLELAQWASEHGYTEIEYS